MAAGNQADEIRAPHSGALIVQAPTRAATCFARATPATLPFIRESALSLGHGGSALVRTACAMQDLSARQPRVGAGGQVIRSIADLHRPPCEVDGSRVIARAGGEPRRDAVDHEGDEHVVAHSVLAGKSR